MPRDAFGALAEHAFGRADQVVFVIGRAPSRRPRARRRAGCGGRSRVDADGSPQRPVRQLGLGGRASGDGEARRAVWSAVGCRLSLAADCRSPSIAACRGRPSRSTARRAAQSRKRGQRERRRRSQAAAELRRWRLSSLSIPHPVQADTCSTAQKNPSAPEAAMNARRAESELRRDEFARSRWTDALLQVGDAPLKPRRPARYRPPFAAAIRRRG